MKIEGLLFHDKSIDLFIIVQTQNLYVIDASGYCLSTHHVSLVTYTTQYTVCCC